jgi:hypothetical protein
MGNLPRYLDDLRPKDVVPWTADSERVNNPSVEEVGKPHSYGI